MTRNPLLHPVTLASMVVLALNDHWWKAAWPGAVTGKISDFAGLVFFPVMLAALGLPRSAAALATALGFAAVKTVPLANEAWNGAFGALYQALGVAQGASLMRDPWDLIALPMVLVLFLLPRSPRRSRCDTPESCPSAS